MPNDLFDSWLQQSIESDCEEPTAMVLSTIGEQNRPSSRVVLLKDFDTEGFYFFTNYNSKKGSELQNNPMASLLFFWPKLERQIRIEGIVSKIAEGRSDDYFQSRPRDSQINACISPQSRKIPDRAALVRKRSAFENELAQGTRSLTRPDFWGGYRLIPDYFEFWQGRPGRLHDRMCYTFAGSKWKIRRLAP